MSVARMTSAWLNSMAWSTRCATYSGLIPDAVVGSVTVKKEKLKIVSLFATEITQRVTQYFSYITAVSF